jgi:hypothetical protein
MVCPMEALIWFLLKYLISSPEPETSGAMVRVTISSIWEPAMSRKSSTDGCSTYLGFWAPMALLLIKGPSK